MYSFPTPTPRLGCRAGNTCPTYVAGRFMKQQNPWEEARPAFVKVRDAYLPDWFYETHQVRIRLEQAVGGHQAGRER